MIHVDYRYFKVNKRVCFKGGFVSMKMNHTAEMVLTEMYSDLMLPVMDNTSQASFNSPPLNFHAI